MMILGFVVHTWRLYVEQLRLTRKILISPLFAFFTVAMVFFAIIELIFIDSTACLFFACSKDYSIRDMVDIVMWY